MNRLHCQHLRYDIGQYLKSVDAEMVDKRHLAKEMVDKWSIKPSLADKLSDILVFMVDKKETKTETIVQQFGFTATTAKRYLRQLTEFGYLAAKGGNRNRTFVQGESRSQVYLDYAEPQPIFVQASAEPNLFGLCRAQPKMSRKGAFYMNQFAQTPSK